MKPRPHAIGSLLHLASAAALAIGLPAMAQTTGTQTVRIVLGTPSGSAPDVVTRAVAEAMANELGEPVVVENRPGAGGTLATATVAAAPADGRMLNVSGCSGDSITHAFVAQGRPPLALFTDLTPVGRVMRDHWLVLTPATLRPSTLKEFADHLRALPQPAAYPSQGEGTTPHLQAERLAQALGFRALHVPYKESATADLVAGRLAFAVQGSASAVPLVKAGRLTAVAVLSEERLAALPDVPTAQEAGLPGHVFNGGVCLWAPGATPLTVLRRLNSALNTALQQPAVRARLATLGVDPTPGALEETNQFVAQFAAEGTRLRAAIMAAPR